MSDDYFYCVTLSSDKKTVTWDPEEKAEYPRSNRLIISQVLLGPEAKADEMNVVQVETMTLQEAVKVPMAVLKVGENRHIRMELEFHDAPVTFTLTQGTGPVHLLGKHMLGAMLEEYDDMEEIEEEMLDEEEGDDIHIKEKNGKTSSDKRKNEEEDDEDGEPKGKKAKMSNNAKGKAASPKKNPKK